jgi:hypothetical protein
VSSSPHRALPSIDNIDKENIDIHVSASNLLSDTCPRRTSSPRTPKAHITTPQSARARPRLRRAGGALSLNSLNSSPSCALAVLALPTERSRSKSLGNNPAEGAPRRGTVRPRSLGGHSPLPLTARAHTRALSVGAGGSPHQGLTTRASRASTTPSKYSTPSKV